MRTPRRRSAVAFAFPLSLPRVPLNRSSSSSLPVAKTSTRPVRTGAFPPTAAASTPTNNQKPAERESTATRRRRRIYAGGEGPLSAEFLSVSGTLATVVAAAGTGLFALLAVLRRIGFIDVLLPGTQLTRLCVVAASSFTHGLLLQRFDLRRATQLRLTLAFSVLTRFLFIPALSHIVAVAGYAVARAGVQRAGGAAATAATAAATAAAQIVHAPPHTVQATADSLSLPAGVLSSLFLLSATAPTLSPAVAMLASHVHATLLAALLAVTHVLFPLLPGVSHALSQRAHASLLNVGSLLPRVAPPPSAALLALTTTLPFCAGVATNRALPPRAAGLLALCAVPASWALALSLLLGAVRDTAAAGVTGLAGSCALCGGVALTMLVVGNVLARALHLQRRARRTLLVYLCAQGCAAGAGLSPAGYAASAHVAAAAVGLVVAVGMGVVWRHVVIRTKAEVM